MGLRQAVKHVLLATLPRYAIVADAGGSVCLTFDDGPHPEHTPRLLDVLAEEGVPATFFVIGERAEKHPKILERIVAEGHALGTHSYHHCAPELVSAARLVEETRRCNLLLMAITGRPSTLARPPYGKITGAKILAMWGERQTIVLWNKDPRDYEHEDAAELPRFFDAHPLSQGDIVLLHDVYPWAARSLPPLVREARDRGLRFTTVLDAL